MTRALITGASGFIGYHLCKKLNELRIETTCLVRPSSNRTLLDPLDCRFAIGDVTDRQSLANALSDDDFDVVYHLAGLTKALAHKQLLAVNERGAHNIAAACADQANPPTLISLSSLSAVHPAKNQKPVDQHSTPAPVSSYGKSKLAGEHAVRSFASRLPITILRPPIVLGEADPVSVTMYQSIANFSLHVHPCWKDNLFSVIHASDLANACVLAAQNARRLSESEPSDGLYYPANDEAYSYADLGRMIGESLGKRKTWVVRTPSPFVWAIAGVNELISQVRRHPTIVNWDKAREATAGSWICDNSQLKQDTGFATAASFADRIAQSVAWYRDQEWLR